MGRGGAPVCIAVPQLPKLRYLHVSVNSRQAAELRLLLRKALGSGEGGRLFAALYRSWAHSAGATLSLCLLARAYEHAAAVVAAFADILVTVEVLVQACFVRDDVQHRKIPLDCCQRGGPRAGVAPVPSWEPSSLGNVTHAQQLRNTQYIGHACKAAPACPGCR